MWIIRSMLRIVTYATYKRLAWSLYFHRSGGYHILSVRIFMHYSQMLRFCTECSRKEQKLKSCELKRFNVYHAIDKPYCKRTLQDFIGLFSFQYSSRLLWEMV